DGGVKVAEAGVGLAGDEDDEMDGSAIPLAHWLRDYAGGVGKSALALKAAKAAFDHSLSLEDFDAVKQWTGDAWDGIRNNLLAHLASAPHAYYRTRIYLSEGFIDDAVRSLGDRFGDRYQDETLRRRAAAAHTSNRDWVISRAMSQAASIMDANKAGHYALAVQWLEKAALAHEVLGREDDWSACVDKLIDQH